MEENEILEPVPTMAGYKKIPTFKLWIANQFPYIETDFDAITNYELLQAVIKYLNTIIENENNVESNVTALYNAFVNLHDYVTHYFDNLDVQEEINNKLDDLVEDGTLTRLIGNYVQPLINAQNQEIAQFKTSVNEQIASQNTRIQAVESGSPLVASSVAGMTDTSRVYVNTTDGHWYWYDGTTWQDGGVYQSTGLDDETIEILKKSKNGNETVFRNKVISTTLEGQYYNDNEELKNATVSANFSSYDLDVSDIEFLALSCSATIEEATGINYYIRGFNYEGVKELYYYGAELLLESKVIDCRNLKHINIAYRDTTEHSITILNAIYKNSKNIVRITPNNNNKVNGYFDDDFVHMAGTNIRSYLIDTSIFENISIRILGNSDIRLFDSNHTLITTLHISNGSYYGQYINIKDYNDLKYITIPWFVSQGDIEEEKINIYAKLKEDSNILYSPQIKKYPNGNNLDNFSVEVNYYEDRLTGNEVGAGALNYTDYGVIAFPKNYTPYGQATKLIIFCQGTGERIGANTNPLNNPGWQYFLSKGYAVMDMNGMSQAWGTAQGFPITNQHYANKYLLQSYKKGYEYVMNNYNLEKEIYLLGLSMGGGASLLIAQSNILPIRAVGEFCPAISVYKQDYMNPWGGINQKKTIAGQWNFNNWSEITEFNQQYFLSNIEKIKGYDNLLTNTIGTTQDVANNNYNNETEANAYNSLTKIFIHPLKIWHCTDDTTVLYRYSEFFVNMIKNGNGKAELRNLGTGGHTGGWNKGSVTDTDIYGNEVTTSIPFYELIKFFEKY